MGTKTGGETSLLASGVGPAPSASCSVVARRTAAGAPSPGPGVCAPARGAFLGHEQSRGHGVRMQGRRLLHIRGGQDGMCGMFVHPQCQTLVTTRLKKPKGVNSPSRMGHGRSGGVGMQVLGCPGIALCGAPRDCNHAHQQENCRDRASQPHPAGCPKEPGLSSKSLCPLGHDNADFCRKTRTLILSMLFSPDPALPGTGHRWKLRGAAPRGQTPSLPV